MNDSNLYRSLFPFEKIQGGRVLLYGAGQRGVSYLRQLLITGYCDVVGIIDKAADKYADYVVPVYFPDQIPNIDFDYIVISVASQGHLPQIYATLDKYGVPQKKIIYIGQRYEVPYKSNRLTAKEQKGIVFSFQNKNKISLAIRLGGGLGDFIVYKKTLLVIATLSEKCLIDLFAESAFGDIQFIRQIYQDIPHINNVFFKGNSSAPEYKDNKNNYMIAVTMNHLLIFDHFSLWEMKEIDYAFAAKMDELRTAVEKSELRNGSLHEQVIHETRAKYSHQNIYTAEYFSEVLGIKDTKVNIPIQQEFEKNFSKLNLKKYITLHYGNGRGEEEVTKQWPFQYYCEFVESFEQKYPMIEIVQVGKESARIIPKCSRYVLGANFNLTALVLQNALFHLDIEGGLVHLATQLGTKCVVLFGPTSVQFYGYEQNINIVADNCKECFGLYPGGFQCAKKLARPECMWSITPAMVMEQITIYMGNCN